MKDERGNRLAAPYSALVRYTEQTAEDYQRRNRQRHRAEIGLIARVFFGHIPRGSVLDIPSGGGRVGLYLARDGYEVTCADNAQAMVDITRRAAASARANIAVDQQDIEAMTYPDGAFDNIVCFRLFHHFPNRDIRARAVREMCRVARERVVLSYFSPWAFSALERKARALIKGRQNKFANSLGELRGYFEPCGFRLERDFGQIPLIQTLHVAIFKRTSSN